MGEPRHLSFVRALRGADYLTIGNGMCGVLAVLAAVRYAGHPDGRALVAALVLVLMGLACDFLDGRVARMRGEASALGGQMDSLADLVTFGVAPAALAYALGLDRTGDAVALAFFALCGLGRLARYNVTAATLADGRGKVPYFEGTPITFGVVPLIVVLALHRAGHLGAMAEVPLHLASLAFVASGMAMISKTIRIPKP